jgi:hypothetical protein
MFPFLKQSSTISSSLYFIYSLFGLDIILKFHIQKIYLKMGIFNCIAMQNFI